MSWNRLLGHMIKSGSLLSANQPSCHPVKQTLNRFFGCMPRAACQPDMWTFKKRVTLPFTPPYSYFAIFFLPLWFLYFLPSHFPTPHFTPPFCLFSVFFSPSVTPICPEHLIPTSFCKFCLQSFFTLQWQSCSSARLRSEPTAKWSGFMMGIGSSECLVHSWIMYLLSVPKQSLHITQACPHRATEACAGFTLHKLRYRFCCPF